MLESPRLVTSFYMSQLVFNKKFTVLIKILLLLKGLKHFNRLDYRLLMLRWKRSKIVSYFVQNGLLERLITSHNFLVSFGSFRNLGSVHKRERDRNIWIIFTVNQYVQFKVILRVPVTFLKDSTSLCNNVNLDGCCLLRNWCLIFI